MDVKTTDRAAETPGAEAPALAVEIPLDRPRSKVYSATRAEITMPASRSLAAALDRRSAGDGDAIVPALIAAAAVVLHRYSGASRIGVGTCRCADGGADALPVALDVTAEARLETLARAAAAAVEAAAQGGTFAQSVARLGLGDIANRNPLFAVAVRVDGVQGPLPDVRNDLTLTLIRDGETWRWSADYSARLIPAARARRFVGHVAGVLETVVTRPGAHIAEIDFLDSEERELLAHLGTGPSDFEADRGTVLEEFAAAAARCLDAPALVFADETLSYDALRRVSRRLAAALRARGAARGTRVGLCVTPSGRLVPALLGVLETGAAVVPLDPTFPRQRLTAMVADGALVLVVAEGALGNRFDSPAPVVDLGDLLAEAARASDAELPDVAGPDDPVYVLFTSGSTGRPKAVVMPHRALANLVRWQARQGKSGVGARTVQRSSIAFDVGFQEVFATLCSGDTLVVAGEAERADVSALVRLIERHAVTRVFLPPIALRQMAEVLADAGAVRSLREVIVAGESLRVTRQIVRLFHEIDSVLTNQYGPTETHVVTARTLAGPSLRWPELPPIGRPIDGARIYILDARGRPTPLGAVGNIHVGGTPVGLGYVGRDDLTAAAFLPDPFVADPAARMYRTGDLGRFREDGEIEFVGRRDDQVKIRGYRVELGDVDAALLQIPGVREAGTRAFADEAGDRWLAAYVVEGDGVPSVARIRELLAERLPAHMVPAAPHVVLLGTLPLTPTGKIDRAALPRPDTAAWSAEHAGERARGGLEVDIAALWARTLGLEAVGATDDFLDLGGHSLAAIRIVADLNERHGISVPLAEVLRGTTVRDLAGLVARLRGDGSDDDNAPERVAAGETLRRVTLPDGRSVVSPHPPEALYMYVDVVERTTYDHPLIAYRPGAAVVDVGANIGLFTLLALDRGAGRVIAVEPAPGPCAALRENTRAAGDRVRVFDCALGARDGAAALTYYPSLTGMGSLHPDAARDGALLAAILANLDALGRSGLRSLGGHRDEFLDNRLRARVIPCDVRTLSRLLADADVDAVDLLKIDVQRGEMDVLAGLTDRDWARIRQVAVELQDVDGALARLVELLRSRGLRVDSRQDALHRGTTVHFVYAARQG